MKKKKLIGLILGSCLLFTACGSTAKDSSEGASVTRNAQTTTESFDSSMEDSKDNAGGTQENQTALTSTNDSGTSGVEITNQKLIKTIYMNVETKEFDNLIGILSQKTDELNGYIESSDVSGNSYEYENMRYATLTIRIPFDVLDRFVSVVEKDANVTNKSESTQDVTLQYVDMSSHVEALRAEQKSLMTILKEAKKVEDIIKIQSQLTDVRYEIESYESQLRTYDNLVNYSTVTISINEVKRETTTETETMSEKITARLSTNLYNIGQGFQNFIIWVVSSLPYILICGVILLFGIYVLRKVNLRETRRKKHRKNIEKESNQTKEDDSKKE
ncbi:MAG: DUF4349 domain-containing protein [Velocimicrobium sp.]